ncbi:hypothetical protein AM501_23990 [Aneurinibacillus migulanus]|uniref:hypothetical protein n=1 Tax=Aneurinibacillus migulanus TaxID=47500 RepID=UPI0005B78178|nr:hypothetical protein [Aneurinibacillus migulanus]KIV58930.1 hypothetical protein TS64_03990 [Aneurinibacillus migulanus]KPD05838.1 hypothetical protein AM501_23990 [Aneurinibacillus migulanus]
MNNKDAMSKNTISLLEKELWGILLLEMSLPSLLELLDLRSLGVNLRRLADWVMFPDKIPVSYHERILTALEHRAEHPRYSQLQLYVMEHWEEEMHELVLEMLYLKVQNDDVSPHYFNQLYKQPVQLFYSLSIQLVERQLVSSHKMIQLFQRYNEKQMNKGDMDE